MEYSLSELRVAAWNWQELPEMDELDRTLWMGLGYCYEWYRAHPEDKEACDRLAREYIEYWNIQKGKEL